MFTCERCGSSYSATHAVSIEHCPRCRGRDRIAARLIVKPPRRLELGRPGSRPTAADLPARPAEPVPPPEAEDRFLQS